MSQDDVITPRGLQAIVAQYERTISGLNARLGDLGWNLARVQDENAELRARVKELEEQATKRAKKKAAAPP